MFFSKFFSSFSPKISLKDFWVFLTSKSSFTTFTSCSSGLFFLIITRPFLFGTTFVGFIILSSSFRIVTFSSVFKIGFAIAGFVISVFIELLITCSLLFVSKAFTSWVSSLTSISFLGFKTFSSTGSLILELFPVIIYCVISSASS